MTDPSKLLHRKMSKTWWLEHRPYTIFMLREFSAVFVALVAVATICLVNVLQSGEAAYASFLETLRSPWAIAFSVVALLFALLHTVTFFTAAGKVLVVRIGATRIPEASIVAGHFAGWVALSALFVWLVL